MTVKDLIKKLQKLPQDAEFVAWNDEREIYVGVDDPQAIKLAENEHDELIDDEDGKVYVTVGLQG